MNSTSSIRLLVISIICLPISLLGDAFIFDLNGVLVDTNKIASFSQLGVKNVARYIIHLRKSPSHIKAKFFDILGNVAQLHRKTNRRRDKRVCDPDGKQLPYYMVQWLKGTMTNEQIKSILFAAINTHPQWFDHKVEQQLVVNLVNMIFTPESFITTRKIHKDGIKFMKACKKHGHQVYILSNWDAESFPLLQKKYPEIFDLVDGTIISAEVHAVKPHKKIYKALLKKYSLNPRKCYFIDDQQENVKAAQYLHINAFVCNRKKYSNKPNFYSVAQDIKQVRFLQHSLDQVTA